jgi:peptidylprolyl isomerase domain and WD repeat-containing protein 1
VKHYRAHLGEFEAQLQNDILLQIGVITGLTLSFDHQRLGTVSPNDKSLKIFDIMNFDMISIVKLPFVPLACEFISENEARVRTIAM